MPPTFTPEHCPYCGSKLGEKEVEGKDRLHCFECERTIWQNAEPVAAVVVKKNNEILLIKRGIEPGKGEWSLPAGFLEYYESPAEAAVRELEEETGVKAEIEDMGYVESKNIERFEGQRLIATIYEVEADKVQGNVSHGSDAEAAEFKTPEDVMKGDEKLRECFKSSIEKSLNRNLEHTS